MTTVEYKNVHIYEQVINFWEKPKQLLKVFQQFPSEFKNDPFLVAVTHHHQCFSQIDFEKSLNIYANLATHNHSYAMNNLAFMYECGQGVKVDYQKAIELYHRAMNMGHCYAMHNLARMYERGHGVLIDYQKAIELYQRAVDLGNLHSGYNLALMYQHGRHQHGQLEKNLFRALEVYLRCKYVYQAQKMIDDCSNLQEKMDLFKICLKYDYYPEHIRIYITILREMWFCDVVAGIYPHQKHPVYNRHMDSLMAKYM